MIEASRASFHHEVQSLTVAAAGETSVGVNPGSYSGGTPLVESKSSRAMRMAGHLNLFLTTACI